MRTLRDELTSEKSIKTFSSSPAAIAAHHDVASGSALRGPVLAELAQRARPTRGVTDTAHFVKKNAGLVVRTASMFVIKKKSAKKSSEEWLSVKTNFLYLGGYFACVRLAYEVCSRLR